ncbi:hypothetical protein AgCh_013549 [Apium graveolens]
MEDSSTLKLVIEKGPRAGETLDFRPGSSIRLGRVVRGNSVTIKDSGISTKHLEIYFDNGLGKWVITDLGSSNGTFLNDVLIDANTPFNLSNNDVVKLGEITLISVNVCDGGEGLRSCSRLGGAGNVVEKPKRGRGRRGKVGGNEVDGVRKDEIGNVKECDNVVAVEENVVEKPKQGCGRKSKVGGIDGVKKYEVEEIGNVDGNGNVVDDEVGFEENVVEKVKRGRAREAKMGGNDGEGVKEGGNGGVGEIGDVEGNSIVVAVEVNRGRKLRSRVTRSVVKEEGGKLGSVEDFGKQLESLAAIERKVRRGRGKKKVVEEEVEKEVVEEKVEKEVVEEKVEQEVGEERRKIEGDLLKELPDAVVDQDVKKNMIDEFCEKLGVEDVLETKDVEQKEEGSRVSKSLVDLGVESDLEKMTLGEWFDFLEVYLPQKIHNETEELISNMKQRAMQFHEHSVQQKRAMGKGKSPMV